VAGGGGGRRKLCLIRALRALQAGTAAGVLLAARRRFVTTPSSARPGLQPMSVRPAVLVAQLQVLRGFAPAVRQGLGRGLTPIGFRSGDAGSGGLRCAGLLATPVRAVGEAQGFWRRGFGRPAVRKASGDAGSGGLRCARLLATWVRAVGEAYFSFDASSV